jgi:hypothetical protein
VRLQPRHPFGRDKKASPGVGAACGRKMRQDARRRKAFCAVPPPPPPRPGQAEKALELRCTATSPDRFPFPTHTWSNIRANSQVSARTASSG